MSKNFSIPKAFLSQLNEFSSGGYLILNFDEAGNPRICCKFDSSAHSLAAKKYLQDWLYAVDELQRDLIIDNLMANQMEDEEEESEEGEDEQD